jgi:hypothetical protein
MAARRKAERRKGRPNIGFRPCRRMPTSQPSLARSNSRLARKSVATLSARRARRSPSERPARSRAFRIPAGSRPPGTPGGCVTELLLGLKTPLVEKGPVPRRATPAANGIGVAAPALAGMPDGIKVEPVTGSCQPRPCHGRLMPKRRHLIVVGSRSPDPAWIASSYPLDSENPLDSERPHKSRSVSR